MRAEASLRLTVATQESVPLRYDADSTEAVNLSPESAVGAVTVISLADIDLSQLKVCDLTETLSVKSRGYGVILAVAFAVRVSAQPARA